MNFNWLEAIISIEKLTWSEENMYSKMWFGFLNKTKITQNKAYGRYKEINKWVKYEKGSWWLINWIDSFAQHSLLLLLFAPHLIFCHWSSHFGDWSICRPQKTWLDANRSLMWNVKMRYAPKEYACSMGINNFIVNQSICNFCSLKQDYKRSQTTRTTTTIIRKKNNGKFHLSKLKIAICNTIQLLCHS